MSEAGNRDESFWTAFLRRLARRGLRGVKLVVSDVHEGLKAAISKIHSATWQRCRVGLLKQSLKLILSVQGRFMGRGMLGRKVRVAISPTTTFSP